MALRELYVFARMEEGFVPAGLLALTETAQRVEASRYAYGTRYLERKKRFEIDPVSLSLAGDIKGVQLVPANRLAQFGGIRDAAPDAWGRRLIEARHRVPANSLPESIYLLEAGSNRVGALDVRDALDASESVGGGTIHSLGYLLEAAERVGRGENIPAQLTALLSDTAGAGGARPKATVRDDQGLLWLAKFPSISDTFDVPAAEYATLQLAALCDISVPAVRLENLGGRAILLVRRFDRYWGNAEDLPPATVLYETLPGEMLAENRLPFVSGLTMLGCGEYDSPAKSYADLAHAVRRYAHTSVIRQNTRELFARMVFNIFVSNDDDHLRNHGFVRDPRLSGWRLSPLYDVVPRPGVAYERFLHLDIGTQGKLATLDNALSRYAVFTLDRPDALGVIREVWGIIRQWRMHFEGWHIPGRVIDQVAPAIRELEDIASPALMREIRKAGE